MVAFIVLVKVNGRLHVILALVAYTSQAQTVFPDILINSDNINLDEETVSLTFFNNIAVPKAKNKLGYQYTSRIHSVIRDGDNSNFVIILYNEYEVKDDQLSGRLDLEHPMFICVGDLTKDRAIDIIYNSYHHSTN